MRSMTRCLTDHPAKPIFEGCERCFFGRSSLNNTVRRDLMKYFYIVTLAVGIYIGILLQGATIVTEKDAGTAKVLSQYPEQWDLSLNGDLKTKLEHMPRFKEDVVVALTKRADYRKERYEEWLWQGIIIIIFSIIGLVRERITNKGKVESGDAPNPHTPTAHGFGGR